MSVIGTPVRRREDYRFLTGQGTYTDDINRPGQLYAYILRSPHANARIAGIDTSAAASAPGVVAVYTGKDMAADGVGGLPCGWQIHSKDGSPMIEPPHPPLVVDRVRHVGDQVAVVIAETPRAGARRRRADPGRLCRGAGGDRPGRGAAAGRAAGLAARRRAISATTGISAISPRSRPRSPRRRGSSSSTSPTTGSSPTRWSRAPRSASSTARPASTRSTRPARTRM